MSIPFYDQRMARTPEDDAPDEPRRPSECRDCGDDGPCPGCLWRYRRQARRMRLLARQSEESCTRCGFLFWVVGLVRRPFTCLRCCGQQPGAHP